MQYLDAWQAACKNLDDAERNELIEAMNGVQDSLGNDFCEGAGEGAMKMAMADIESDDSKMADLVKVICPKYLLIAAWDKQEEPEYDGSGERIDNKKEEVVEEKDKPEDATFPIVYNGEVG